MIRTAPAVMLPRAYWQDDAACLGKPLELFFGSEDTPLTPAQAQAGRALCMSCPVRRDCLLDALLTNERAGLRGGYLGYERKHALARYKGSVQSAMAAYDAGSFYRPVRRKR